MALSKDDFQLYFLLVLIGTFAALSFSILLPYLIYILAGVILVYINYPLYRRIRNKLNYEPVAAALTILIVFVVTFIPALYLIGATISQGQLILTQYGTQLPQYIDTTVLEMQILELTGQNVDINQLIRNTVREAGTLFSSELPRLVRTLIDGIIGILLMLFTMYYLFKDGDKTVDAVMQVVPLRDAHKESLFSEADSMAEAILIGHLLTSAVQGIIAGIGLYLVGIPNVVFWTFVMILLGLVPVIGNVLVWGPAGLYLIFIQGQPLAGIGLLLYGITIVGFTDNLVRAKFVESRANVHPLLVLIGVIGGLPVYGILGVVLGPLTLGFFVALLRVYSTDFWQ